MGTAKSTAPETIESFEAGARPKRDTPDFTEDQRLSPFWTRHNGPYRLVLTRPHKIKVGTFTTEWLVGEEPGDEAQELALSLMADPKDTVVGVSIWSVRDQQIVFAYDKGK